MINADFIPWKSPNVVAHNKLDISQTIEANLGLSAQLVGDRYTVINRLKEYEA